MHLILFGLQEPDAESKAKVYEKKPNYTKKTGCRSCVKKLGHWAETMRCRWCQRSQHSIEFGISVHLLFFILRCPSFVSLFMAEWAIQGMIISRRQYFLYSMKNMERDVNERRYNRRREEKKRFSVSRFGAHKSFDWAQKRAFRSRDPIGFLCPLLASATLGQNFVAATLE